MDILIFNVFIYVKAVGHDSIGSTLYINTLICVIMLAKCSLLQQKEEKCEYIKNIYIYTIRGCYKI